MSTPRILIAEDDHHTDAIVPLLTLRTEIEHDVAADGVAAIALLEQTPYDVVLVDLMLPRVDGHSIVEWIGRSAEPRPAVIVTTSEYSRHTLDSSTVTCAIRKPFDAGLVVDLISEIGTHLASHETRRRRDRGTGAREQDAPQRNQLRP